MPTYNQIIVPVTEHQGSQPLTLMIFDETNRKQSKGEIILQLGKSNNIDQPGYNKILLHEKNMAQEEKPPPPFIYIFLNPTFSPLHPTTKPTRTFPSLHDKLWFNRQCTGFPRKSFSTNHKAHLVDGS